MTDKELIANMMNAMQYAINRLDADKNQPQVSGDLAVALAYAKACKTETPLYEAVIKQRDLIALAYNISLSGNTPKALSILRQVPTEPKIPTVAEARRIYGIPTAQESFTRFVTSLLR